MEILFTTSHLTFVICHHFQKPLTTKTQSTLSLLTEYALCSL